MACKAVIFDLFGTLVNNLGGEFGRLAIRDQDFAPVDDLRLARHDLPNPIGIGACDQVEILVRPANGAHPALPVADADDRDDTFHSRIDRRRPYHRDR